MLNLRLRSTKLGLAHLHLSCNLGPGPGRTEDPTNFKSRSTFPVWTGVMSPRSNPRLNGVYGNHHSPYTEKWNIPSPDAISSLPVTADPSDLLSPFRSPRERRNRSSFWCLVRIQWRSRISWKGKGTSFRFPSLILGKVSFFLPFYFFGVSDNDC